MLRSLHFEYAQHLKDAGSPGGSQDIGVSNRISVFQSPHLEGKKDSGRNASSLPAKLHSQVDL